MKRHFIPALALCSAFLIQSLPAAAAYSGADEIAFRVLDRENKGAYVCCQQDDLSDDTSLPLSVYLDADRAEVSLLGIALKPTSPCITFDADSLHSPSSPRYEEEQVFDIPGITDSISTKLQPYCLGEVTSMGVYTPHCFACNLNADAETNTLNIYWMYGIGQAESFLGEDSMAYSFVDFDVKISPDTPPGIHFIRFLAAETAEESEAEKLTYITSDNGTREKSVYSTILPAMQDFAVIVEGEPAKGDANGDVTVNAEDAAAMLIYAADKGAGETPFLSPAEAHNARLLSQADVNEDGVLDASDAAATLLYSAAKGAGEDIAWSDII